MTTFERLSFASEGRAITVEVYGSAETAEPGPAVIMLHGADGLHANAQYRSGAKGIAAAGFRVFLVHYLDRTAERRASFATVFQNFPLWMNTVRDALSFASNNPGVDSGRIGLVGISLGAALGLAVAGQDRRIKALVDYFGPVPQGALQHGSKLPPTLILHGGSDPVVPVANAHAIESLLIQQGSFVDIKVYPGQGHGFRGAAERDATERALAFLHWHLQDDTAKAAPLSAAG
jgi:carboxymethylenebutenolidase